MNHVGALVRTLVDPVVRDLLLLRVKDFSLHWRIQERCRGGGGHKDDKDTVLVLSHVHCIPHEQVWSGCSTKCIHGRPVPAVI